MAHWCIVKFPSFPLNVPRTGLTFELSDVPLTGLTFELSDVLTGLTFELSGETLKHTKVVTQVHVLTPNLLSFSESFTSRMKQTHVHRLAVARVNHDGHLPQVASGLSVAVRLDLLQQDSGHHVSGEAQVPRADGGEGQRRHPVALGLLQATSDDGHQVLRQGRSYIVANTVSSPPANL